MMTMRSPDLGTIHMRDVMAGITLRVKGLTMAKLRFRIAAVVFQIGALIAGVGIEIETDAPK